MDKCFVSLLTISNQMFFYQLPTVYTISTTVPTGQLLAVTTYPKGCNNYIKK